MPDSLRRADVVAVLGAVALALGLVKALRSLDHCSLGEIAQPLRLLLGLAPLPLSVAAGRLSLLAVALGVALLVLALVPGPGPGGFVDCYFDTSAWQATTPLAWFALVTLIEFGALLGLVLRKQR